MFVPGHPPCRRGQRAALAGLALLIAGCSQQLHGGLDEPSANEVVSALRVEGIDAHKALEGEGRWKVTVADSDFAVAVQVMRRKNLPPRQFDGLGTVFKKESLVSTPTEERARLIHAMSQELERSLMQLDGVVVARVHPVIPPHDPLNPRTHAATASVLIKYRPGAEVAQRESLVRTLVASGVEGLSYDDVRVLMVAAEALPLSAAVEASRGRALPPVFWAVLALQLGLLLLGYFVLKWRDRSLVVLDELRGRMIRRRKGAPASSPAPTAAPAAPTPGQSPASSSD